MTFTTGQRTPSPQMSPAVTLYPPGTPPPVSPWWHWMLAMSTMRRSPVTGSSPKTGAKTL